MVLSILLLTTVPVTDRVTFSGALT